MTHTRPRRRGHSRASRYGAGDSLIALGPFGVRLRRQRDNLRRSAQMWKSLVDLESPSGAEGGDAGVGWAAA
jgi:hypothetical protein